MLQQLAQKGARADWVGSVLVAPALACSAATARPWVAWAQGGGPRCGETRSVVAQVRRLAQVAWGALRPAGRPQALRRIQNTSNKCVPASAFSPRFRLFSNLFLCQL